MRQKARRQDREWARADSGAGRGLQTMYVRKQPGAARPPNRKPTLNTGGKSLGAWPSVIWEEDEGVSEDEGASDEEESTGWEGEAGAFGEWCEVQLTLGDFSMHITERRLAGRTAAAVAALPTGG